MKQGLTRRQFLKVAGAGAAGTSLLGLAGCGTTEPAPDELTNVVLVILDTLRKDHVGAHGNSWIRTPTLDALADESLIFTQARPESLPTICARRAIHTGMRTWPFRDWQHNKGVDAALYGWQPIPEGQPHLADILRENGYETLLVTDNLQQYDASMNFQQGFDAFDHIRGQSTDEYRPAWAFSDDRLGKALVRGSSPGRPGSTEYFRRYFANTAFRRSEEDWFAPLVFNRASEYLDGAGSGGPFFMVVDCYDPHPPWDPPEEYTNLYDDPYDGPEPYTLTEGRGAYLTERELKRAKALYAGEVTMTDRWLGRFLDRMEELDLMENTLLLVVSDHGIALGEHGFVGKPHYVLWPEVTDTIFYVRHPRGNGAGETSDYYASTHDVAPTVLGFLGIDQPQPMQGEDLSVLLDGGQPAARDHFTLGYHNFVWTRDGDHLMFGRNDGAIPFMKLYDIREDPEMMRNIAAEQPDTVRRMFSDYVLKDAGGPLPTY